MLGCSKIPQSVAQTLTYLPSMLKALGSVDSTEKSNDLELPGMVTPVIL